MLGTSVDTSVKTSNSDILIFWFW